MTLLRTSFLLCLLVAACSTENGSPGGGSQTGGASGSATYPLTGGTAGAPGSTGSGGVSASASGGSDAAAQNGSGGGPGTGQADAASDTSAGNDAAPIPDGAGCSGWSTLQRLSPQALHDLLGTLDPFLINVHCPYAGELPGTDTTIYFTSVDAIEAFVGYDHCADIVLTCLGGPMSQQAGSTLVSRGYQRVRDLQGGMTAWQAAGYQLVYRDAGGCP
jgi:phage shock protein E